MDKPDAWMPHYIGDYNMETVHLTAQQDGIYMRLRSFYWKSGGPIPADLVLLSRAARIFTDQESDDLVYILKTFFEISGTQCHHHELDKRYMDSWDRYTKKSEAGKKAVAVREKRKKERAQSTSIDDQTITKTITTIKPKKRAHNHHWASAAVDRSDKSRFSRMARTYPEIYSELKKQGVTAISTNDYKRLTTVERPLTNSLSPSPSPLPRNLSTNTNNSSGEQNEVLFARMFDESEVKLRGLYPQADFAAERELCITHYKAQPLVLDPYLVILKWFNRIPKEQKAVAGSQAARASPGKSENRRQNERLEAAQRMLKRIDHEETETFGTVEAGGGV